MNLSHWFQLDDIPINAIYGYYSPGLVFLSYIVAVLASYVALDLVGSLRTEHRKRARYFWLVGGAFAMGAGIWSMHFIGMLAYVMSMPMKFELTWTVASLLAAVLASALALFILQKENYSLAHLIFGGVIIGLAIATMHYMGMEGMKTHVNIHYLPGLFILSIIIAVTAAEAALWLSLRTNQGTSRRQFYTKLVSALIMGIAICGMHYTGMEAAVFTPLMTYPMSQSHLEIISTYYMPFFIAGTTILILILALITSTYKKIISNEKAFLKAMLNNLEDGIIACNAVGKITVVNDVLHRKISANIVGKYVQDLPKYFNFYSSNNELITDEKIPLKRVLKGEKIQGIPFLIKFKNDLVNDVIIDGQEIFNASGKVIGALTVIHDVTELKKTEKLKKEFVSIVSHELRTPLTSIRGSLGLLISGTMGSFPEKATKLLEIANNNCERLLLLINDILDIEKIEAGKMEFRLVEKDLQNLVNEAIESNKMYAEKYDVKIKCTELAESFKVNVDPDRLIQVLNNLISNACKFSTKGNDVVISIEKLDKMVRVSVYNYGSEIPLEFRPRIFQKFSQADSSDTRGKSGSGLGLNISRAIIEKLEGRINFTSSPENTRFYFDLPLIESTPRGLSLNKESIRPQNNQRLLICEDDEDQANYLQALLESASYETDIAHSVKEAKMLLELNQYHAILMDLVLPDQDGVSFIRELRTDQNTKDIPIIVLSVIAETGRSLLNGDAISVVDWLDKPIDSNALLDSIRRIKNLGMNKPNILHIEDNVEQQHIISTLLNKNANVTTASNLRQAKDMLQHKRYDLVILDLLLPDGNGMEILPWLAKYQFPVLVFSNFELSKDYAKYVSQALVKSKSSNEVLLKTITNLL
ncbi:MHYT domain-containing protein [Legionella parisiensis]|uniref:histidine kinase n=1 Tax=Legionella parisiensis TaxID=45071 RepID=A0A1E5JWG8_9GAMM|nr:MHYT domain-containing protein [Legionella parisiensis]KTD41790.1 sensory box histidine kinase/response regulator [Legionella parisiensis]OEH48862.1 Alginate biosynthesis sensor protein KinB [Legionella parisiensis]STX75885.1 sensory box histidine kinase/response regulator [Legionella parisiensis]